jgi:3-keto-5-aminohexanoate cleavage enzyme
MTDANYLEHIWRFSNSWDYVERVRRGLPPLIVTVAITGGGQGKEDNPNIPESPLEQAESTYEAYESGASIVHIHARNPNSLGYMSCDPARYYEINRLVRERCPDIIINNTSGGDLIDFGPSGGRNGMCWASLDANPEIASFDCGPLAYRITLKKRLPPLSGRQDDVVLEDTFHMGFEEMATNAKLALQRGIKPEFEIFHTGQYWLMDYVTTKGLAKKPYWVQFVMGVQNGAYATPMELLHLVSELPDDSLFSVIGVGPFQLPIATLSIILGGHVRVGLEDNIYYGRGEKAKSNAQLVERVVRVAKEHGRTIADPLTARRMLGISEAPTQYPSGKAPVAANS